MIKTFKYTTDLENAYGVREFGLKKGDIFKLIETKLSYIEKTKDTLSVYHYEYFINIPKEGCFILDGEMWGELIIYSEYVDSK